MGVNHETFYYVRTLEKIEIALADVFNDMRVNKYNDINRKQVDRTVDVPLVLYYDKSFGNWISFNKPKDRILRLPMAGIRFEGMKKDTNFTSQSTYTRKIYSRKIEQFVTDLEPSPYKITYNLSFIMDNKSDLGQLLENVLPYFKTVRSLRINEFDFARDIERKIPFTIGDPNIKMPESANNTSADANFIEVNIPITLSNCPMYRPIELAEIIKYAEFNVRVDDIVDSHQWFIYPDDLVDDERKPWESVGESIKEGWSFVRSICRTLKRNIDLEGNIVYENISLPPCDRPVGVPSTKQLHLLFNEDSDLESDQSGYNRDFILLNSASREFLPNMIIEGGQEVSGGYQSDTQWDQILTWFGTDDGEHESPFSFDVRLQFIEDEVPTDTIFQRLENKAAQGISAGEIYFEWGLEDSRLYYEFKTVGSNALHIKFKSSESLLNILDSTSIFRFVFVLYSKGHDGVFAHSTNEQDLIALDTNKEIL
jgi:hypothetical protein